MGSKIVGETTIICPLSLLGDVWSGKPGHCSKIAAQDGLYALLKTLLRIYVCCSDKLSLCPLT